MMPTDANKPAHRHSIMPSIQPTTAGAIASQMNQYTSERTMPIIWHLSFARWYAWIRSGVAAGGTFVACGTSTGCGVAATGASVGSCVESFNVYPFLRFGPLLGLRGTS